MIEFKKQINNSFILIVDGVERGNFPTEKKANEFYNNVVAKELKECKTLSVEGSVSGKANQKNDEVVLKRRGRPKKVGTDERNSSV